jgi:hypothetical protein
MFLRPALIAAVSFVAVTAAAASETTRAPGAYASLTTSNAAACARACAEDGICMAWSFHADNQCQLSAVVGQASPQALAAGFASRAPTFLQQRAPAFQAEAPAQPSPPTMVEADAEEVPAPAETEQDDLVLLGGPGEGDLRLGLR